MLDRRRFLLTTAAGAGLAATGGAVFAQEAGSADAALSTVMDGITRDHLLSSPELLTMLGMDKGPGAAMKAQLDDRSLAKQQEDKVKFVASMTALTVLGPMPNQGC